MEQINEVVKTLSAFSAIAVSLTAIIGLLSLVFKPIRKIIIWVYKRVTGAKDKNEAVLKRIADVETTLSNKVDEVRVDLTQMIQEVSDSNDKNEKNRIRWEILDFANSCKNGREHTQDEFRHVIELKDEYEALLKKTGEKNGYFDAEFEYILHLYY